MGMVASVYRDMIIKRCYDKDTTSKIMDNFCKELKVDENLKMSLFQNFNKYQHYIAVKNGNVIGGCGCNNKYAQYLWVDKNYRNSFVGGLLCRKMLKDNNNKMLIMVHRDRLKLYEKLKMKPLFYIMERC